MKSFSVTLLVSFAISTLALGFDEIAVTKYSQEEQDLFVCDGETCAFLGEVDDPAPQQMACNFSANRAAVLEGADSSGIAVSDAKCEYQPPPPALVTSGCVRLKMTVTVSCPDGFTVAPGYPYAVALTAPQNSGEIGSWSNTEGSTYEWTYNNPPMTIQHLVGVTSVNGLNISVRVYCHRFRLLGLQEIVQGYSETWKFRCGPQ